MIDQSQGGLNPLRGPWAALAALTESYPMARAGSKTTWRPDESALPGRRRSPPIEKPPDRARLLPRDRIFLDCRQRPRHRPGLNVVCVVLAVRPAGRIDRFRLGKMRGQWPTVAVSLTNAFDEVCDQHVWSVYRFALRGVSRKHVAAVPLEMGDSSRPGAEPARDLILEGQLQLWKLTKAYFASNEAGFELVFVMVR